MTVYPTSSRPFRRHHPAVAILHSLLLALMLISMIAPAHPVTAAPMPLKQAAAAGVAAAATSLSAPPVADAPPPASDSCAAVLPASHAAATSCLFGTVILDGEPVADATVSLDLPGGRSTFWTQLDDSAAEPRYAIDLSDSSLDVGPGDRIRIEAQFSSYRRVVESYEVQPGQQRLDLILTTTREGDLVPAGVLAPPRGSGSLRNPAAVAVDPNTGHVYVAEWQGASRVQVFDSAGNVLREWGKLGDARGQIGYARGLAVDTRGHVYVADYDNNRIHKYSSDGVLLDSWGEKLNRPDGVPLDGWKETLSSPSAVATFGNNRVYVADRGNRRVLVFESNGTVSAEWKALEDNSRPFFRGQPLSLAVDSVGDVYVADVDNKEVWKFDSTGQHIAHWAADGGLRDGTTAAEITLSVGPGATSGQEQLYVADPVEAFVHIFDLDGRFIGRRGTGVKGNGADQFDLPAGVATARDGTLYVADQYNHRIQRFTATGAQLPAWTSAPLGGGALITPSDIARDSSGRLFVADTMSDQPQGNGTNDQINIFGANGNFLQTLSGLATPQGLAISPDGTLYVAEAGANRIRSYQVLPDLIELTTPISEPFTALADVAASATELYVAESGAQGRILVFDRRNGELKWERPSPNASQIAADSTGRVYVTDHPNHCIRIYTSAEETGSSLGTCGEDNVFYLPGGITISDGKIYVLNTWGFQVVVFDETTHKELGRFGTVGNSPGEFGPSYGLVADPQGRVYLADNNNGRVVVFRPQSDGRELPSATIVQASPHILAPGQSMTVSGSGVSPVGTPINRYEWQIDGVTQTSLSAPTITLGSNLAHGRHSVSLRAYDQDGRVSEPQTITFEVDACLAAPQGSSQPPGCLLGSVYIDGRPVAGAQVVVTVPGQKALETTTEMRPGEPYPTYRIDLAALSVEAGSTLTLNASFSGHQREVSHTVLNGRQHVDLVLPRNRPDDYMLASVYWRPAPGGSLQFPYGVALDSRKNVYIADQLNHRIQVFGPGGQFLRQWGTLREGRDELFRPTSLTIDKDDIDGDDHVFVTASRAGTGRVFEFTVDGVLLRSWGGPASPVQFSSPVDVARFDSYLYVLDQTDRRVVRLNLGTGEITPWSVPGGDSSERGRFARPAGIAADQSGNIYVADTGNNRIQKFTRDGAFVHLWGSENGGASQFNRPEGITVDSTGNVYVVDRNSGHIKRLAAASAAANSGEFEIWPAQAQNNGTGITFFLPSDVAVDSEDDLYVVTPHQGRYQVFDSNGTLRHTQVTAGSALSSSPLSDAQPLFPTDLTLDRNGDLVIADTWNGRIQRWTPDGAWLESIGRPGAGPGEFGFAQCVARDEAGSLYVCDGVRNRVQVLSQEGNFLRQWNGSEGRSAQDAFGNPLDIAIDSNNGVVWVADVGPAPGRWRIQRFTLQGAFIAQLTLTGLPSGVSLTKATGLALDRNGSLYISDLPEQGEGCIYRVRETGAYETHWCGVRASQIEVGADGMLYVSDTEYDRMRKYAPNGTLLAEWRDTQLDGPSGVAVDAGGQVYVADSQSSRILHFQPMRDERPVATIVQDSTRVLVPGQQLRLVGTGGSSMPDTTIKGYEWRLNGRLIGARSALSVTAEELNPGLHTLALRVRDSRGLMSAPRQIHFVVASTPLHVAADGDDTGDCRATPCRTIGAALAKAAAGDTVSVAAGVYSEQVTLSRDVALVGAGPGNTVIDVRREGRPLLVNDGVTATVVGLSIRGGLVADGLGGGVLNNGVLTLADSIVAENLSRQAGGGVASNTFDPLTLLNSAVVGNRSFAIGGGIHGDGTLTIIASLISGNTSQQVGGGIFSIRGLTMRDSAVSANEVVVDASGSDPVVINGNGGGLGVVGSGLIERSSVVGNRAESNGDYAVGGGLIHTDWTNNSGTLTILESEISGNATISHGDAAEGGAISNYGDMVIAGSTIGENSATGPSAHGGAIYNVEGATLRIRNSALLLNTARAHVGDASGGGITNDGTGELLNSTLSSNRAVEADRESTFGGGGLYSSGASTLNVTFSTIAENFHSYQGGGILANTGTVTLTASILANNSAPSGPNCARSVISLGYTVISERDGCDYRVGIGDKLDVNPLLAPLAANGGSTLTQALRPGSPAFDIALPSTLCPTSDQRGSLRPQGAGCDIGAYELDVALDTGLDIAEDVWGVDNLAGELQGDQFIEDYGYPSTTRLITDTKLVGVLKGSVALTLPLDLSTLGMTAALPLAAPSAPDDPASSLRIRDLFATMYEQVVVSAAVEVNKDYEGVQRSGLCAGMAAGAADFHRVATAGLPPPSQVSTYGGIDTVRSIPFTRSDGPQARDFIQLLHGRQVGLDVLEHLATTGQHTPRSLYDHLVQRIANPAVWWSDPEIIGIVAGSDCEGMEIGHALLPYRVETDGAIARIFVYDPNYPADGADGAANHALELDLTNNVWRYEIAPAANGKPAVVWSGDVMYRMPLSLFLKKPRLPTDGQGLLFINGGQRAGYGGQRAGYGGQRAGYGELTGPDGKPLRVGCYVDGDDGSLFLREIDRFYRVAAFNGYRPGNYFPNATYFPDPQGLTFTSVGGTTTDMLVFGPGSAVGILTPASKTTQDTLRVSQDLHTIVLETTDSLKDVAAYQIHDAPGTGSTDQTDRRFIGVSNLKLAADETISMTTDLTMGQVTITNNSAAGAPSKEFELGFATVGTKAVGTVMFEDVTIGADERRTYTLLQWNEPAASPLLVQIDKGADGVYDEQELIVPPEAIPGVFPAVARVTAVPDTTGTIFPLLRTDAGDMTVPNHYGWVSLDIPLAPGQLPKASMWRGKSVLRKWLIKGGGPELVPGMGLVSVPGKNGQIFDMLGKQLPGKEDQYYIGKVVTVPLYDAVFPASRGRPPYYRIAGYAVVRIVDSTAAYNPRKSCKLYPGIPQPVCGRRIMAELLQKQLFPLSR